MTHKLFLSLLIALSVVPSADAQSLECPWRNSQLMRWVTTDKFTVFICSAEGRPQTAKYYHGVDNNSGAKIRLPLSSVRGDVFTARNGQYRYILDTTNVPQATLTIVLPSGKRVVQQGNMQLD